MSNPLSKDWIADEARTITDTLKVQSYLHDETLSQFLPNVSIQCQDTDDVGCRGKDWTWGQSQILSKYSCKLHDKTLSHSIHHASNLLWKDWTAAVARTVTDTLKVQS